MIREATHEDLRSMAEVLAAAFHHEELFGHLLHPYRDEYPDDYLRYFEYMMWKHLLDPSRRVLVALDQAGAKIVGVGSWERQGSTASRASTAGEMGWLAPQKLYQTLASKWTDAQFKMWPNKAADPTKANVFEESFAFYKHHWAGSRENTWYLAFLGVHPDYQRKHHGKELVEWGIEQATKDGVCASVISSYGSEGFYGRFGFVEVGRSNVGPLAELKGGAIMFTEVL
ncbi:hypothetical protein BP5796_06171 [Coleophoma crateriformis]|uniref:N-acetyltransferase domain-containing protein n=1 Tax=Coleophoma crateriformis TaxID=565419 RepID=A0A3D8RW72_9HELO|nr:hypothetical protein BP5796_06171 [Coleophoma crateriformis]